MALLEEIREMMKDNSLHVAIAKIKALNIAGDGSVLNVEAEILPDEREIVARMTWECVGPESGFFCFPAVEDLVLVAFTENEDQAFVIRRMTSKADKIPETAKDSSMVMKALAGKRVWITSDNKILLSKGDTEPTENLVLGQVFKTFMADYITEIKTLIEAMKVETHLGALPGFPTGVPINAATYETQKLAIDALKTGKIDSEDILSDISFTEKGT